MFPASARQYAVEQARAHRTDLSCSASRHDHRGACRSSFAPTTNPVALLNLKLTTPAPANGGGSSIEHALQMVGLR